MLRAEKPAVKGIELVSAEKQTEGNSSAETKLQIFAGLPLSKQEEIIL
jgi:hypothetical protein